MAQEKITQRKLSSIKVDPNQPRRHKDQVAIEDLARNLEQVGMINPIEVDKSGVIVTGESRYLAAKLLGWKTVPTRTIDIEKTDREIRQVSENLIRHNMDPYDVGLILKAHHLGVGDEPPLTYVQIGEKFGIQKSMVAYYVKCVDAPPEILKMIRDGVMDVRAAYVLSTINDQELLAWIVERMKNKTLTNRQQIEAVRSWVRHGGSYENADKILKSNASSSTKVDLLRQGAPTLSRQFKVNLEPGTRIIKAMSDLALVLDHTHAKDIAPLHFGRLMTTYEIMTKKVEEFETELRLLGHNKQEHEHLITEGHDGGRKA